MATDVRAWILALGGRPLLDWVHNPRFPLYLWGTMPATGKSLFAEAWKRAKPAAPQIVTGNDHLGPDDYLKIHVPLGTSAVAKDLAFTLDLASVVVWLKVNA